mmetsp:Transcript_26305/g.80943  ORF Transcript_26305/g.80943 Transcript_26305/m.80943 type:complete len:279 (+) Transcript_26305:830-1666(+)
MDRKRTSNGPSWYRSKSPMLWICDGSKLAWTGRPRRRARNAEKGIVAEPTASSSADGMTAKAAPKSMQDDQKHDPVNRISQTSGSSLSGMASNVTRTPLTPARFKLFPDHAPPTNHREMPAKPPFAVRSVPDAARTVRAADRRYSSSYSSSSPRTVRRTSMVDRPPMTRSERPVQPWCQPLYPPSMRSTRVSSSWSAPARRTARTIARSLRIVTSRLGVVAARRRVGQRGDLKRVCRCVLKVHGVAIEPGILESRTKRARGHRGIVTGSQSRLSFGCV